MARSRLIAALLLVVIGAAGLLGYRELPVTAVTVPGLLVMASLAVITARSRAAGCSTPSS